MTSPRDPKHADTTAPVPGADPRFAVRRHLVGYAYPTNGNLHNPTPRYDWHLLLDGRLVDRASTRRAVVEAARTNGAAAYEEDRALTSDTNTRPGGLT